MAEKESWAFPPSVQPEPDEVGFDLERTLDAVVQVHSEIPQDAFTASILGTERLGNGVAIGKDGLVLTIGYLVTEAESIWLTANSGAVVAGYPLAYDQATGFGLVQPLGRLEVPFLQRGSAASCKAGDDVLVIGQGGRAHALRAKLVAKREFAGYWEYVLDEALFTAPAHPQWGGAAIVDAQGKLVGIGSLLVQEVLDGQQIQGNMAVPIDLLEPILDGMLKTGRSPQRPRPWLGMYTTEVNGQLVVAGVADNGPADQAGIQVRDVVIAVEGERPATLADLFRTIWSLGPPGTEVTLTFSRGTQRLQAKVRSADRNDFLRKPQLH
jgi:S1-C subfamily serine protease